MCYDVMYYSIQIHKVIVQFLEIREFMHIKIVLGMNVYAHTAMMKTFGAWQGDLKLGLIISVNTMKFSA